MAQNMHRLMNSLKEILQSPDLASAHAQTYKLAKNLALSQRRQEVKDSLIAYKGGFCQRCGGHFENHLFDFHHVDPELKKFKLDKSNFTKPYKELTAEADKCVLLCCLCHRNVHHEAGDL